MKAAKLLRGLLISVLFGMAGPLNAQTVVITSTNSVPTENVVISQPDYSVNSGQADRVYFNGKTYIDGQTFTPTESFALGSFTIQLRAVDPFSADASTFAVSLFTYSSANTNVPASLLWTATGNLPQTLATDFAAQPDSTYLTFTLPTTLLDAGTTYGIMIYETGGGPGMLLGMNWNGGYSDGQRTHLDSSTQLPGALTGFPEDATNADLTFWITAAVPEASSVYLCSLGAFAVLLFKRWSRKRE